MVSSGRAGPGGGGGSFPGGSYRAAFGAGGLKAHSAWREKFTFFHRLAPFTPLWLPWTQWIFFFFFSQSLRGNRIVQVGSHHKSEWSNHENLHLRDVGKPDSWVSAGPVRTPARPGDVGAGTPRRGPRHPAAGALGSPGADAQALLPERACAAAARCGVVDTFV